MVFFILDGRTESWLYLLPGTDVSVFRQACLGMLLTTHI
jgi:hypothetical protein